MKYAAGITLYNPSVSQINHIKQYSTIFDKVFVFDNSEPNYDKPNYSFPDNYIIITENCNKGLPYAYNRIIQHVDCSDIDFLCTLDQDSIFENNEIKKIFDFLENNDNSDIGIVAPYIDYGFGKHNHFSSIESKKWVITSGSFVNLSVINRYDIKYDEGYFIDKFEIDLCKQLDTKGLKILMFHDAILKQELGEYSGHRHPNHNWLRHYYLFRNRFYFNNKFYNGIKKYFLSFSQSFKHCLLIIMYENNKARKIRQIKKAYKDYKIGKMGKYNE